MEQYKVNLKISILKEVTSCQYNIEMKDLIVNAIYESMIYTNNPSQSRIIKKQYGVDVIIMTYIVMKCSYKERVYDVPVIICFMKKIPNEPPHFYVDLPAGKAINPKNKEIDSNSRRIMTVKLLKWVSTMDMTSVLDEIQESFNRNFPIVNISNNQSKTNQSVYSNNNQQQQQQGNAYYNQQQQMINLYNNSQSKIIRDDRTNLSIKLNPSNNVIQPSANQQSIFTIEQADNFLEKILQTEIMEKIDSRIKDEKNKMLQQKDRLINYQKLFIIEEKKLMNYIDNISNIQQMSNDKFKDINLEISNVCKYIAQNESKTLQGNNIMDFINIGNERNAKILSLISQEAMSEEIMSISKKAFERQSCKFIEAIKFIRAQSRSLFKVKYIREKLQQMR